MYMLAGLKQSGVSEKRKTVSVVRIGHVNLRGADLDRAISFYRGGLGLSVIEYALSVGIPTVILAFGHWPHNAGGGQDIPATVD
jgi:catechol 2,3-dioxygenase-like lactoylglutathione lyase family enzyme